MKDSKNSREYRILMNQYKRLQGRNTLLAEVLASERARRKYEQQQYCKVIKSPFKRFQKQLIYAVCSLAEGRNL